MEYSKLIAIIVGMWAFVVCSAIFGAYMEAKTYTKLTGVKVTTWDAMWVELRVQTGPGTQEK